MKRAGFIWLLTVPLVLTSSVGAWGYDGHRRVNYTAANQLDGPFGRFLKQNAEALKWYAPAADYIKGSDPNEFPRHFIDADYYDTFPFNNIPIDYDSLLSQYGEAKVKKMGMAPWAIESTCDRVIYLFKNNRFEEAIFYMGNLGHYIADLHMPLHTVLNYNGQFTGNKGVHFRWEGRLVDDYIQKIKPLGSVEKISDPVSFSMDIIRESFASHKQLFDADTKARKVLSVEQAKALNSYNILPFEKPYLDILYKESGPLLHERLGKAVVRIASIWEYCWVEAGSPELP